MAVIDVDVGVALPEELVVAAAEFASIDIASIAMAVVAVAAAAAVFYAGFADVDAEAVVAVVVEVVVVVKVESGADAVYSSIMFDMMHQCCKRSVSVERHAHYY